MIKIMMQKMLKNLKRENEELINRVKDSKDFNKVFNELFVNMHMVIDEDTGYGEWLKNDNPGSNYQNAILLSDMAASI